MPFRKFWNSSVEHEEERTGMNRQSKGKPSHEKRYLVPVGLSVMAQVGIQNRLCVYAMEDARTLLGENMVTTDTNGRNNQINAERGETYEQGFLCCWRSTPRS